MAIKDVKKKKPLKPFGYKKLIEQSGKPEREFLLELLAQYKSVANIARNTNITRQTLMKRLKENGVHYTGATVENTYQIDEPKT
jgi:DNA invertase Pin-like site-specific DNA recombinase